MKLKNLLLIFGTSIIVLSVSVYVNLYLQRSKASEIADCIVYTPADYNQDGSINLLDYHIWLTNNQGTDVCPSPTPAPIILNAKEDTFVNSNYPNNNSGRDSDLKVKASPTKITYMKFDLTALAGKLINSAKLRLWISDPSNGFIEVHSVIDNSWIDKGLTDYSWTEKDLTYNSRPYINLGNLIQSFTAEKSGTYKDIDITGFVKNNRGKMMSLAFQTSSTNELEFKSRNVKDPAKRPVLVLQTSSTEENTPPKTISSWIDGLQNAPPGSRYPFIAPLDESLDPSIYGYDTSDEVSAAINMTMHDGSIVNTYVNINAPDTDLAFVRSDDPTEICTEVKCFFIWANNFTTSQTGYHKITMRVADSNGTEAPPIVYEFMVVTDPPTAPLPSPTPGKCASDNECLNYQTCDLAAGVCKNLVCPVPLQCKIFSIDNHNCLLDNSPDGMLCTSSGNQGTCQGGICTVIPIQILTPTPSPTCSPMPDRK